MISLSFIYLIKDKKSYRNSNIKFSELINQRFMFSLDYFIETQNNIFDFRQHFPIFDEDLENFFSK